MFAQVFDIVDPVLKGGRGQKRDVCPELRARTEGRVRRVLQTGDDMYIDFRQVGKTLEQSLRRRAEIGIRRRIILVMLPAVRGKNCDFHQATRWKARL